MFTFAHPKPILFSEFYVPGLKVPIPMKNAFLRYLWLLLVLFAVSCGTQSSGTGEDSPTGAYKRLYAAVKAKDIEGIKKQITKKSIDFGKMAAERNKTPMEKMYENGFTATTFAGTLPTMRDERINGDMGALEVWNSKDSRWEDLPFIKEDGAWKLAVGDVFAGTYQSPGKGMDQLEKEAANAVSNTQIPSVDTNKIPITNSMPAAPRKDAKAK